jgi:hypothetical protein
MKTLLTALFMSLATMTLTAQDATPTLNLQKGQSITIKSMNKQRIQQSVSGQEIAVDVTTDRVITARLLDKTAQELTFSITYDTLRSVTKSAMFSRETNSATPGSEPIEKVLNKLSQTAMVVKMSPTGKFLRFDNYTQLREGILRVLDDVPASKREATLKQAEALLKESALRSMVEPLFGYLPEKPIKVGDTWETSYISSSNDMNFVVLVNHTANNVEGGMLGYSTAGQLETLPATDPNAQISMDLKGTSTGEGRIDAKTGLRTLDTEKASYKGTATVKQMGQEMTIPMSIDSESTTTMTL